MCKCTYLQLFEWAKLRLCGWSCSRHVGLLEMSGQKRSIPSSPTSWGSPAGVLGNRFCEFAYLIFISSFHLLTGFFFSPKRTMHTPQNVESPLCTWGRLVPGSYGHTNPQCPGHRMDQHNIGIEYICIPQHTSLSLYSQCKFYANSCYIEKWCLDMLSTDTNFLWYFHSVVGWIHGDSWGAHEHKHPTVTFLDDLCGRWGWPWDVVLTQVRGWLSRASGAAGYFLADKGQGTVPNLSLHSV